MDNFKKHFIKDNIEDIEKNNWERFYSNLNAEANDAYRLSDVTSMLLQAGINPLNYIESVPVYYLYKQNIDKMFLPKNIKTIKYYAFGQCRNLNHINLENVDLIGRKAFEFCDDLDIVQLKDHVKVYDNAFESCVITKLILPNNFIFEKDSFLGTVVDEIIYDGTEEEYKTLTNHLNSSALTLPHQIKYLR